LTKQLAAGMRHVGSVVPPARHVDQLVSRSPVGPPDQRRRRRCAASSSRKPSHEVHVEEERLHPRLQFWREWEADPVMAVTKRPPEQASTEESTMNLLFRPRHPRRRAGRSPDEYSWFIMKHVPKCGARSSSAWAGPAKVLQEVLDRSACGRRSSKPCRRWPSSVQDAAAHDVAQSAGRRARSRAARPGFSSPV